MRVVPKKMVKTTKNKRMVKNIKIEIISIMEKVPIGWISDVPDRCGTYVITTQSGKIYVGSSKRIRNRMLTHMYNNVSIIEPIEFVSFYVTKDHMDARILEYALIKELGPELNVDILNRDDIISYHEELLRFSPNLLMTLKMLIDHNRSLAYVQEHIRKGLITYQVCMESFCAIRINRDSLQISLKIDEAKFIDPCDLCTKVRRTLWTYNRHIEIYNADKIDIIFGFIRQAYRFTVKE